MSDERDRRGRDRPPSYFHPHPQLARRFLFHEDIREWTQYSSTLPVDALAMRFGDLECTDCVNPFYFVFFGFLPTFSTYGRLHPLTHEARERLCYPPAPGQGDGLFERFLALSSALRLSDDQIALGPEEDIERAFGRILGQGHDPCFFFYSCVAKVIGTDLDGIVSNLSRRHGVRIIDDPNVGMERVYEQVARMHGRDIAAEPPPLPGERRVNLVGFTEDRSTPELVGALGRLGITVNRIVVPDLSRLSVADLQNADLQVLYPAPRYGKLYEDFFERLPVPTIALPAPFGLEATRAWVEEIAGALGVSPGEHPGWTEHVDGHRNAWKALQKRARQHTIGMVLGPADVDALADPPAHLAAVPLLSILEEMGFGLSLVVDAPEGTDATGKLKRLLRRPRAHEIVRAGSAQEVERWMASDRIRCIYSDLKNDTRITSRGKATFSYLLFEHGFEGARRGLDALLRLCESRYLGTYGEYRKKRATPVGC
jgi:hypothetical protein